MILNAPLAGRGTREGMHSGGPTCRALCTFRVSMMLSSCSRSSSSSSWRVSKCWLLAFSYCSWISNSSTCRAYAPPCQSVHKVKFGLKQTPHLSPHGTPGNHLALFWTSLLPASGAAGSPSAAPSLDVALPQLLVCALDFLVFFLQLQDLAGG